jgi:hypothetical protein
MSDAGTESQPRLAVIALARPTFDMEFAGTRLAAMLSRLKDATGTQGTEPLMVTDSDSAAAAMATLGTREFDAILILQLTFTDAAFIAELAETFAQPLSIWAVPEPRLGGRLRLNAFCGLNLAAHALGLNERLFSWLYVDPDDRRAGDGLARLLSAQHQVVPLFGQAARGDAAAGQALLSGLRGRRIGRIGAHPTGFHTCAYDPLKLRALAGIEVDELDLSQLFDAARSVPEEAAEMVRAEAGGSLRGLDAVDQGQLNRSLKLKSALSEMQRGGAYDAFAIRCWPEPFTDYGGAVCGPVSMMGEARVPCACEADVYGAVSQLLVQAVSGAAVFLTDIVDMDGEDDSGVVWHCGQAPASMAADPEAMEATIHTNRRMPLLYQFALKPGRVTLARISQARGQTCLVLGAGDVLDRPMAFTGTSGVVRFDGGTGQALDRLIAGGIEHHLVLAYGDHREALQNFAAAARLPVLDLSVTA